MVEGVSVIHSPSLSSSLPVVSLIVSDLVSPESLPLEDTHLVFRLFSPSSFAAGSVRAGAVGESTETAEDMIPGNREVRSFAVV